MKGKKINCYIGNTIIYFEIHISYDTVKNVNVGLKLSTFVERF